MSLELIKLHGAAFAQVTVSGLAGGRIERARAALWRQSSWREPASWRGPEPSEALFAAPGTAGGGYIDPASRAAVAAARMLKPCLPSGLPAHRLGCILGTRTGNAFTVALYEAARLAGKRASPLLFAHAGWNVPAALTAGELGCRGYVCTLCAGPQSGREALRQAHRALRRGRSDLIAAGVVGLSEPAPDNEAGAVVQAHCLLCALGYTGRAGRRLTNLDPAEFMRIMDAQPAFPEEILEFAFALTGAQMASAYE